MYIICQFACHNTLNASLFRYLKLSSLIHYTNIAQVELILPNAALAAGILREIGEIEIVICIQDEDNLINKFSMPHDHTRSITKIIRRIDID